MMILTDADLNGFTLNRLILLPLPIYPLKKTTGFCTHGCVQIQFINQHRLFTSIFQQFTSSFLAFLPFDQVNYHKILLNNENFNFTYIFYLFTHFYYLSYQTSINIKISHKCPHPFSFFHFSVILNNLLDQRLLNQFKKKNIFNQISIIPHINILIQFIE